MYKKCDYKIETALKLPCSITRAEITRKRKQENILFRWKIFKCIKVNGKIQRKALRIVPFRYMFFFEVLPFTYDLKLERKTPRCAMIFFQVIPFADGSWCVSRGL